MRKTLALLMAVVPSVCLSQGAYTPDQIRDAVRQAGGPEAMLKGMSAGAAKTSGQMFDDRTQITGVLALEKTLTFYLRLVNYEKSEIDSIDETRAKIASALAPSVCTAPVSSILINEYGVAYNYMAYSNSRAYLFQYSFDKETCSPGYVW